MSEIKRRSCQHATFVIERTYAASPARVFAAWADPAVKARWFNGPSAWQSQGYVLDFRVGGREHLRTGAPGGSPVSLPRLALIPCGTR